MLLRFAADNPYRPADWRWQRAMAIHERVPGVSAASRRRDGVEGFKWITRAVRFIEEYSSSDTEVSRARLAERRPDIFWAHWAWTNPNAVKYIIESHLLARSSDYDIAFRCNMAPRGVTAYEALFFNVREKIQHRSYILNVIIGSAIHRGLSEREYDILWKLYGYFLGPHLVDALEGKFANPTWCSDPTSVGAAVMDDAVGTLKLKAALAAKTVPVNQHTQLAIMDAFTKFVEIERNTDTAGKAQEQILDHIAAMMTTLPFNVGGRSSRTGPVAMSSPVDAFEKTAIELTYEETMRLSVRMPIAHQDMLRGLSFPITESTQQLEAPKKS